MGSKDREITFPFPLNFGKKEGQEDVSGDESRHQYRQCFSCKKHYSSYRITDKKEPQCLFCWEHQKASAKGLQVIPTELEKGWLVAPKDIPIPAKTEQMLLIRHIEKRSNIFGTSIFLYVKDTEGNISWINGREVRRIADNNEECNSAWQWVLRQQIINPISNAMEGMEGIEEDAEQEVKEVA